MQFNSGEYLFHEHSSKTYYSGTIHRRLIVLSPRDLMIKEISYSGVLVRHGEKRISTSTPELFAFATAAFSLSEIDYTFPISKMICSDPEFLKHYKYSLVAK